MDTYVGGSKECIETVLRHPDLEALPTTSDARLDLGGGVIHVPALTFILKVPLRVASATSLLVLVVTSLSAILTLFLSGAIDEGWRRAGLLGLGALAGAQLGVYLSTRINPKGVLLLLAIAMAMVGTRQLVAGFS